MRAQLILLSFLALSPFEARAQQAELSALKCESGPVNQQLGWHSWLVYSCDDQRSMVVVTPAENPASPFVFVLRSDAGRYEITGEGNGDKAASDAAGDALSRLSPDDLAALLAETKRSPNGR